MWRINLIFLLILVLAATIIGRLVFIQIIQADYWRALAQGQQKFFSEVKGERGKFFLKSNNQQHLIPLTVNKNWGLCFIAPNEIPPQRQEEIAEILSQTLNLKNDFVLEKIRREDRFYELIKKKLTEEERENLKKLNLPGVYLGSEILRYYPQESLASQVIGFVGGEGRGQYGIEEYYNDILEGSEGFQEGEKNPQGFLFKLTGNVPQKGADLVLAVDYNIQFMAEKLLKEAKNSFDIEEGTIIVSEPNSGKIVALANFPNFNPNQYSEVESLEIFQNSAFQKIFEPGSVFKPITMAAALDQGKVTPQTTFVDEGFVKIGGYTIYNYGMKTWGERSMTEVLERSINTGAIFAERQVGHQAFSDYIKRFGFFEPTGIDLPGEVFSENKAFKKGYEVNFATASFGQGIEITPIQLVSAFLTIANGGKLIKPYVVEKIIDNDKIIETQPEITNYSVISQKTASQLTAMLVSVIEQGSGKLAKIPGYYIAGKTGTAQISWSALGQNKSGYSEKTIQSFIGFAPAFNPKFLILVKLNNPKAKTAEYSTAPLFRDLAKYIIDYWQIPPDYE